MNLFGQLGVALTSAELKFVKDLQIVFIEL